MVLTSSHQVMVVVSLALCACFLLPRMFGGVDVVRQEPRRIAPIMRGNSLKENPGKNQMRGGGAERSYSSIDQIKGAMEQELKAEKMGSGRTMAFTLMPLYAVGVALFAAYKFTKLNPKDNGKSKSGNLDDKKARETENQLKELEQHLSQTEQMLQALLTQLDPLSNCVNTLATEQKNEIMNQLQSIRRLMKKSGMDKSALHNSANNNTCEDTLEDLIHSLKTENSDILERDEDNESEASILDTEETDGTNCVTEEPCHTAVNHVRGEDLAQLHGTDATSSHVTGLRKRNVKD